MCRLAYTSRTDILICTNLGMLIPPDQEENIGGSRLRKSILSSIPGMGGSCSSETKHDRRTAPRAKSFVSKRRLQKQRSKPQKTVLSLIPDKDGFCCSETKHDRRTAPCPNLFKIFLDFVHCLNYK
jgi:hypothetical protein